MFSRLSLLTLVAGIVFARSLLAETSTPAPSAQPPVILFVHGAWGGAWQFSKVDPLLRAKGYDVRRVTLTGLGERSHLASKEIGLETHIQDVMNVILFERLENVILVGHSYGGMVVTGVADRLPGRIKQLVYLDAMLPNDGESAQDLMGSSEWIASMTKDGMIVPPWAKPAGTYPNDVPHPAKTFSDHLALKNPAREKIPTTYILTVDPGKKPEEDAFWKSAERARAHGWKVITMEADHNPQWRKPVETADLLGSVQ